MEITIAMKVLYTAPTPSCACSCIDVHINPHPTTCLALRYPTQGGSASTVVIGSDLTKEYVEVNADYRS